MPTFGQGAHCGSAGSTNGAPGLPNGVHAPATNGGGAFRFGVPDAKHLGFAGPGGDAFARGAPTAFNSALLSAICYPYTARGQGQRTSTAPAGRAALFLHACMRASSAPRLQCRTHPWLQGEAGCVCGAIVSSGVSVLLFGYTSLTCALLAFVANSEPTLLKVSTTIV